MKSAEYTLPVSSGMPTQPPVQEDLSYERLDPALIAAVCAAHEGLRTSSRSADYSSPAAAQFKREASTIAPEPSSLAAMSGQGRAVPAVDETDRRSNKVSASDLMLRRPTGPTLKPARLQDRPHVV